MFVTMERPNMYFNEHGQLSHIHLVRHLATKEMMRPCLVCLHAISLVALVVPQLRTGTAPFR